MIAQPGMRVHGVVVLHPAVDQGERSSGIRKGVNQDVRKRSLRRLIALADAL